MTSVLVRSRVMSISTTCSFFQVCFSLRGCKIFSDCSPLNHITCNCSQKRERGQRIQFGVKVPLNTQSKTYIRFFLKFSLMLVFRLESSSIIKLPYAQEKKLCKNSLLARCILQIGHYLPDHSGK